MKKPKWERGRKVARIGSLCVPGTWTVLILKQPSWRWYYSCFTDEKPDTPSDVLEPGKKASSVQCQSLLPHRAADHKAGCGGCAGTGASNEDTADQIS